MTTKQTITLELDLALSPKSKAFLANLIALQPADDQPEPTPAAVAAPQPSTTPPAPGTYWPGQGGHYICTLPALLDMPARHLIAAAEEHSGLQFGPYEDVPSATSHINGPTNTTALVSASEKHAAAVWASKYTADGHTDFFLPARLDLLMAYICAPQLFQKSAYWSSTQDDRSYAFYQSFDGGGSGWGIKDFELRCRAFRVIPLPL